MNKLITPSKPNLWQGTPTPHASSCLTVEQINEMEGRSQVRRDVYLRTRRGPIFYTHRILIEPKTLQDIATTKSFECPVIGITKDRKRICVITPSGLETWLDLK